MRALGQLVETKKYLGMLSIEESDQTLENVLGHTRRIRGELQRMLGEVEFSVKLMLDDTDDFE